MDNENRERFSNKIKEMHSDSLMTERDWILWFIDNPKWPNQRFVPLLIHHKDLSMLKATNPPEFNS